MEESTRWLIHRKVPVILSGATSKNRYDEQTGTKNNECRR